MEAKEAAGEKDKPKSSKAKKTMAELDEELRLKMEGRSGEGGEAGLELEDGRPAAMKRESEDHVSQPNMQWHRRLHYRTLRILLPILPNLD
ncbi:MAG: hypothetical protein LQ338_000424 [Usnochroma carphineum]|nr:MAG: hypothetical protein LQ338_000424 [Usnochroma carphineum]